MIPPRGLLRIQRRLNLARAEATLALRGEYHEMAANLLAEADDVDHFLAYVAELEAAARPRPGTEHPPEGVRVLVRVRGATSFMIASRGPSGRWQIDGAIGPLPDEYVLVWYPLPTFPSTETSDRI